MRPPPILRRLAKIVAIVLAATTMSGCAAVQQHFSSMCSGLLIRAEKQHQLADVREDTREALAKQLQETQRIEAQAQIEQAKIDATQRQIERELCLTRQQQQQEQVQQQLKHVLESKIAFNAQHGMEIGELEVDTDALKTLMEQRQQEQNQPPTQNQEGPPTPCKCCDQPCGCRPGLLRRLCPKCSRKPCEAEKDCGGPARYAQMQQQQQKAPLRPAEIPLKLPVRLTFGLQQPQIEESRTRRIPPPSQEQNEPGCCPHCRKPGSHGACPDGCIDKDNKSGWTAPPGAAPVMIDLPPVPEPSGENDLTGRGFQTTRGSAVMPVSNATTTTRRTTSRTE